MFDTIVESLHQNAMDGPRNLCVVDSGRALSFEACWRMSYGFGLWLEERGLQPGDRVASITRQNCAHVVVQFAVTLMGGVFVPLEAKLTPERAVPIADEVQARFIISEANDGYGARFVPLKEALLHPFDGDLKAHPDWPHPESPMCILFTTGTTGKSKGVVQSHGGYAAYVRTITPVVGAEPGRAELIPIPINHVFGIRRLCGCIAMAQTVVLPTSVAFVDDVLGMMRDYRVSGITLVPAVLSLLLKLSGDRLREFAGQLRHISMASSTLPAKEREHLLNMLPNTHLYNMYGTTEGGLCAWIDYSQGESEPGTVGLPDASVKLKFVNADGQDMEATSDNPGRIAWAGPSLMIEYWNEPKLTRETLRDGYVCTSDLGYLDQAGQLRLVGRTTDIINVGGYKVSPSEIEEQAMLIPEVDECACVPMADKHAGQVPRLCVVMKADATFSEERILRFLERRMPSPMLPRRVDEVDQLPKTYNGKLLRRQLIENLKECDKIG